MDNSLCLQLLFEIECHGCLSQMSISYQIFSLLIQALIF